MDTLPRKEWRGRGSYPVTYFGFWRGGGAGFSPSSFGHSRSRNSRTERSSMAANDGCQGCWIQNRSRSATTLASIRVPSCLVFFFARGITAKGKRVVTNSIFQFPARNQLDMYSSICYHNRQVDDPTFSPVSSRAAELKGAL